MDKALTVHVILNTAPDGYYMLIVIDNYDSFTYNLVQYLGELGADIQVYRNDTVTIQEIEQLGPKQIVVSPGPRTPNEAGISVEVIQRFAGRIPLLGVCLGHQSLAAAFGGEIVRANRLMHGKISWVKHDGRMLFEGLPNPFEATRYHSLIVNRDTLPNDFEISATTDEGEIMGLRHLPTGAEGVQFHPESILTKSGMALLRNFLAFDSGKGLPSTTQESKRAKEASI